MVRVSRNVLHVSIGWIWLRLFVCCVESVSIPTRTNWMMYCVGLDWVQLLCVCVIFTLCSCLWVWALSLRKHIMALHAYGRDPYIIWWFNYTHTNTRAALIRTICNAYHYVTYICDNPPASAAVCGWPFTEMSKHRTLRRKNGCALLAPEWMMITCALRFILGRQSEIGFRLERYDTRLHAELKLQWRFNVDAPNKHLWTLHFRKYVCLYGSSACSFTRNNNHNTLARTRHTIIRSSHIPSRSARTDGHRNRSKRIFLTSLDTAEESNGNDTLW